MHTDEIAELIVSKMKNCNVYMESEKKTRNSIRARLNQTYKFELESVLMYLESRKHQGKVVTKEDYARAFKKVEDKVMNDAEFLSVVNKDELQQVLDKNKEKD